MSYKIKRHRVPYWHGNDHACGGLEIASAAPRLRGAEPSAGTYRARGQENFHTAFLCMSGLGVKKSQGYKSKRK